MCVKVDLGWASSQCFSVELHCFWVLLLLESLLTTTAYLMVTAKFIQQQLSPSTGLSSKADWGRAGHAEYTIHLSI